MVMDKKLGGYYGSINRINRIKYDKETLSVLSDQKFINGFKGGGTYMDHNFVDRPPFSSDLNPGVVVPPFGMTTEVDSHADYDFSDGVLKFINQMLMEEDMEEKTCMFQESAALQAAERSFYEVLGEKYPPSPDHRQIRYLDQNVKNSNEFYGGTANSDYNTSSSTGSSLIVPGLTCDQGRYESPPGWSVAVDLASQSTPQSSFSSSSSSGNAVDGLVDSPESMLRVPDKFNDTRSVLQFKKGVEEASKFLPHIDGLCLDSGSNFVKEAKEEEKSVVVKVETEYALDGLRGKKNPHPDELDLEEGRSNKQSAVYADGTVRSEMFDRVLLCNGGKSESALREALQNGVNKNMQESGQSKGSNGGKARGKKKGHKKDVVDLRTLLTLCAQSVAADDRRSASELLKKIRQHSSSTGDGMQRMAHYFANGLEARMAGSGNQSYKAVITKPTSAAEILKAYHLYLAVCPFKKVSNFFANKTIMQLSEKATTLHIIDFGILYGFQWPCLIQRLSSRAGGPPKLRITGIDLPNSGFRPAERVEETGRRLANYANSFNVPFEFHAIAQKWETIQIEDLKLDRNETLVVNCQYRFRNLLDETVVMESPREIVLNLIRKMKPDVYIQGVVNGSYNAPFFITRFREAIFHYSSLFDMLEATVPRDVNERMLIEKQIFGWEAMNVIACEGAERIERPETYKQWQVRNLRAGFKQLPLNREIMNMSKERVNAWYQKDFVIDEDGHWMLLGWKGRIIYALSSWKPAY
ncbi:scarecrow-like protein 30 [Actinidia eriantha]|uniref:scarecrow-like protein 30 n=1 Tax=Actinidia eriantha TaxID=165200 RepID=UPI002585334B|nr:scarecrow-like protein 30 [Actinidia eriantha]